MMTWLLLKRRLNCGLKVILNICDVNSMLRRNGVDLYALL